MAGELALPTAEDIRRMPLRARVAFAARCARRVLPAYRLLDPQRAVTHAEFLAGAAGAAEQAAVGHPVADLAGLRRQVADVAYGGVLDVGSRPLAAVRGAYQLARVVHHAVRCAAGGDYYTPRHTTVSAHDAAADAARAAGFDLAPAVRADFDRVARLTAGWADDAPVPPDVFGPLWPDGPPPGWPEA